VIHPSFFEKRVQSSHGAHGAGGSGVGSAVSKLLLAACSVGVGASFSAPIGAAGTLLNLVELPKWCHFMSFHVISCHFMSFHAVAMCS
jgi:hypothetical protein